MVGGMADSRVLRGLQVDRSFTPGHSPSREDAHKLPGREGQIAFEPAGREVTSRGVGLVELEVYAAAQRHREGKALREDELPCPTDSICEAKRGEPAAVSPRAEREDGRDEGLT